MECIRGARAPVLCVVCFVPGRAFGVRCWALGESDIDPNGPIPTWKSYQQVDCIRSGAREDRYNGSVVMLRLVFSLLTSVGHSVKLLVGPTDLTAIALSNTIDPVVIANSGAGPYRYQGGWERLTIPEALPVSRFWLVGLSKNGRYLAAQTYDSNNEPSSVCRFENAKWSTFGRPGALVTTVGDDGSMFGFRYVNSAFSARHFLPNNMEAGMFSGHSLTITSAVNESAFGGFTGSEDPSTCRPVISFGGKIRRLSIPVGCFAAKVVKVLNADTAIGIAYKHSGVKSIPHSMAVVWERNKLTALPFQRTAKGERLQVEPVDITDNHTVMGRITRTLPGKPPVVSFFSWSNRRMRRFAPAMPAGYTMRDMVAASDRYVLVTGARLTQRTYVETPALVRLPQ